MPVAKGDQIKVWGTVDDDAVFWLRPDLYAEYLELPSGERIRVSGHSEHEN